MNYATLRRIAGLGIMSLSVGWVAWRLATDQEALDVLFSVDAGVMIGLITLQAIYLVPQAYRYRLAIEHTGNTPIPGGYWFRIFVLGRFLNSVLPQAGNAYRGVRLKQDYGIPITKYLGGFVAFTWLSTLMNMTIAILVIAAIEPGITIAEFSGLLAASLLLVAFAAGPPLLLWLTRRFQSGSSFLGWMHRRVEDLLASAVSVARAPSVLLPFVGVGLAGLMIVTGIFAVTFDAVNVDASLAVVLLFYVILQISTYVNITPGNLGVFELAFGALGSQMEMGLVGGLLVATLIRITGYAALLAAGLSLGGLKLLRRRPEPLDPA